MIDLTGIIAISGQPGLYKVVAQSKNGIIVEGLADKKRTSISSTAKVSSLEDISMFTTGEDKPVSEIMKPIFDKEKGGACVDAKADDVKFLQLILKQFYLSMIKSVFTLVICVNYLLGIMVYKPRGNLKVKEAETTEESAEKKIVKKQQLRKKQQLKKQLLKILLKQKQVQVLKKQLVLEKLV